MRVLTDHIINPCNDKLRIVVEGDPGAGGAYHRYHIDGFSTASNPDAGQGVDEKNLVILFQNGPIAEAGVNGITHEVLLAILADRLRSFQAGPYACAENAAALIHVYAAAEALKARTLSRMRRGVEGTHQQ